MNLSDLSSLDAALYVVRFCFNSIVSLFGDNFTAIIYLCIIFSAIVCIVPIFNGALRSSTKG